MEHLGDRRTVPWIFIDDTSLGGFEALFALDKSAGLDNLLMANE